VIESMSLFDPLRKWSTLGVSAINLCIVPLHLRYRKITYLQLKR